MANREPNAQERRPLSDEINIATRSLHTKLNKVITSRLRLCLPPHASDPSIYSAGFAPFAQIYLVFERVWDDIVHEEKAQTKRLEQSWINVTPYKDQLADRAQNSRDVEVIRFLRALRPIGLARSDRIRHDLSFLLNIAPSEVGERLEALPATAMRRWKSHIEQSVGSKPHILLAYAWTLCMAIFSAEAGYAASL